MTVTATDRRSRQTPVRDQGDRPSCVGFAVSAAHEWMATGDVVRSPEDALWAGHQEGGVAHQEATSVQLALAGLSRLGHAFEYAWPYGRPPWPADRPRDALDATNRRELPSWRTIATLDFTAIAAELGGGAAVLLTLGVVRSVWLYGDGVIDAEPGRRTPGRHAVVVVGIAEDPDTSSMRLIIKNSWGRSWGNDGYGLVSQRYLEAYGVVAHALEAEA
ncbi:MAG: hypothetical protein GEU83_14750 [Pseudonocardiaceae bacterium]|nr:hypothetical protein [Pseudonocardiaceae bacterium]